MTILYHKTSFERAESILWNRAISGCAWGNTVSHEASPHFYMEGERESFNALPSGVEPDITLYFESDLPLQTCPNHFPSPNVINKHYGISGEFWQATIRPGQTIIFKKAQFNENNSSKFLQRLVEKRMGDEIRTVWNFEMNYQDLPREEKYEHNYPDNIKKLLFRLNLLTS
ncbi:hypothetical protein ACMAUO_18495 [Gluconacetobacter sp. Hr-1-5]|uniref:hypothetical protein n=1 Tax=Gluconacetobacter sp. Hr-1-5 TaxID=3395370 RepID=UPI003B52E647